MRWVRLLLRIFGWLLTPFLALAASFFGALGGTLVAMRVRDPRTGLVISAAMGAIAAFVAIVIWLRVLRQSRHVREVLAVQSDGTPDIVTAPDPVGSPNPVP
jgi:predicted membrane-bound spermidine synthase